MLKRRNQDCSYHYYNYNFIIYTNSNTMSSTAALPSPSKALRFIVTGFGPFDVDAFPEENPTTVLAETLVEYLQQVHPSLMDTCVIQPLVMETSIQGAQTGIDQVHEQLMKTTTPTIVLHLGVNRKGTHFQIERCAYNETHFRIPDQCGNQPQNKAIFSEDPLGCALPTSLPVHDILENIQKKYSDRNLEPCVSISDDPGRFVCNYAYCYSLRKFKDIDRVQCLFVHVPPFQVCSQTEQLEFLATLLKALKDLVEKDN
jgi:pyroglutamyl-peptidase